ncbi:uncharacterized protein LOC143029760 [Oratosquilla oratoria]|uniref:uncharacterized protein LOC143029760 n=1 Tax=Oratosquilla oratoria TaxID=337810 RepID=UPI003F76D02C
MEFEENTTLRVLEDYITDIERGNPSWRDRIRSCQLENHDVASTVLGVRVEEPPKGKCRHATTEERKESGLGNHVNGHVEYNRDHDSVTNGFGGRSGEVNHEMNGAIEDHQGSQRCKDDHEGINRHEEDFQEMNGYLDDLEEMDKETRRPDEVRNFREIFRTAVHPVYGRHLVAAGNIQAGKVVLVEPPIVLAPKAKCAPCCMTCLTINAGDFMCPGCGFFLCGPDCMKKEHDEECRILGGLGLSKPPEEAQRTEDELLAKRIACLSAEDQKEALALAERARKASSNSVKLEVMRRYALVAALRTLLTMARSSKLRSILLSLQDHLDDSRTTKRWWSNKRCIVDILTETLKIEEDPEMVHRVCGIWDTNAFEVEVGHGGTGRALYPLAALINHSCRANCQQWFTHDGTFVLRAVEDIKKDQILTTSYTEPLWSTQLRQDHLRLSKYFTCLCERCVDPTEMGTFLGSLTCSSCQTAPLVSTCPSDVGAPWKCHGGCQEKVSAQMVMSKSTEVVALMKKFKATGVKKVGIVSQHFEGVLYPTHHALIQLKLVTLGLKPDLKAMDDDELHQWATWTRQLHDVIICVEAPLTRQRARIDIEYVKAHIELCRRAREKQFDREKKPLKEDATTSDLQKTLPISRDEIEILKKALKDSTRVLRWDRRMMDPTSIERDFEEILEIA